MFVPLQFISFILRKYQGKFADKVAYILGDYLLLGVLSKRKTKEKSHMVFQE